MQVFSIDSLVRPPAPGAGLSRYAVRKSLDLLACRNEVVPAMVVLQNDQPVENVKVECRISRIPAEAVELRAVGAVPVPEVNGLVSDVLFPIEPLEVNRTAAVWISVKVPADQRPGRYEGKITAKAGKESASLPFTLEVLDITLPDARDWSFFLNVWANPATVAARHRVKLWSKKHWTLLEPYIRDLASHGQKTAVVPIAEQPWGTQTCIPFPNTIKWTGDGETFDFDFSIFDQYVKLHFKHGIDRMIHCYSLVQGPGKTNQSTITYTDPDGQVQTMITEVGDDRYVNAWTQFLRKFVEHLRQMGWLERTYLGFDEKPGELMETILSFVRKTVPELKLSVAVNTRHPVWNEIDDISYSGMFDEQGMAEVVPEARKSDDKITTYYVCCGPMHPNTFIHSPLVESRMLPWLSRQGGYDGFLRWSYNDWTQDPFAHPEWNYPGWPTGDIFFVYPGEDGPVSSLRWEQLMCGIQDFELIRMLAEKIEGKPSMRKKLAEAVSIACRGAASGGAKPADLHRARRKVLRIADGSQSQS